VRFEDLTLKKFEFVNLLMNHRFQIIVTLVCLVRGRGVRNYVIKYQKGERRGQPKCSVSFLQNIGWFAMLKYSVFEKFKRDVKYGVGSKNWPKNVTFNLNGLMAPFCAVTHFIVGSSTNESIKNYNNNIFTFITFP
jgi:hypothetical protein